MKDWNWTKRIVVFGCGALAFGILALLIFDGAPTPSLPSPPAAVGDESGRLLEENQRLRAENDDLREERDEALAASSGLQLERTCEFLAVELEFNRERIGSLDDSIANANDLIEVAQPVIFAMGDLGIVPELLLELIAGRAIVDLAEIGLAAAKVEAIHPLQRDLGCD